MNGKITALQLRQAGFPDEFVLDYIEDRRPYLKQAGFTDTQINNHYGIEQQYNGDYEDILDNHESNQAVLTSEQHISSGSESFAETLTAEKKALTTNKNAETSLLQTDGQPVKIESGGEETAVTNQVNSEANSVLENAEVESKENADPMEATLFNTQMLGNSELLANVNAEIENATEEGVMFYDQLTDGQKKIYNRNRRPPAGITKILFRDEEGVTEEEKDKMGVLHTGYTTGKYTVNYQEKLISDGITDYFGAKTLNEYASFVARFESDNANIINDDNTKSGLWQLNNEELPSLIQTWINDQKLINPEFKVPPQLKEAMVHKNAAKLPIPLQRTLFWAKMLNTDGMEDLLPRIAKGDKVAMAEGLNLINPPSIRTRSEQIEKNKRRITDIIVDMAQSTAMNATGMGMGMNPYGDPELLEAELKELQDATTKLENGINQETYDSALANKTAIQERLQEINRLIDTENYMQDVSLDAMEQGINTGDIEGAEDEGEAALERQKRLEKLSKEREELTKQLEETDNVLQTNVVPDEFVVPRPNFDERSGETFNEFNTANYKYQLPELASFSQDGVDWWVTEKLIESGAGKFVRYSGGAGPNTVWQKGATMSVAGLVAHFHQLVTVDGMTPTEAYQETFMWQTQSFGQDILQSTATMALDFPLMVGGCVALNAGAGLATGGGSAVLAPVICGAGAFAVPEMLRDIYMRALSEGKVYSMGEVMEQLFKAETFKTGIKYGTIGGATAGTGQFFRLAGQGLKPFVLPNAALQQGAKYNKKGELILTKGGAEKVYDVATTGAAYSAEIGTMVTLTSIFNGVAPTRHDFAHAAVMIFGMNRAQKGMGWLGEIYRKYGWHPKDVYTLTKNRPDIKNELQRGEEPEFFINQSQAMLNKMETATDTKFVPEPKFELGTVVNTSASSTSTGKVVGRRTDKDGQYELEIQKENTGERVFVKEAEVTAHEPVGTTKVEVDANGKVTVTNEVRTDFKEQQVKKVFEPDVVEVVQPTVTVKNKATGKDVEVKKSETRFKEEVETEVKSEQKSETFFKDPDATIVTTKNAAGTKDVFFDVAAFPLLAKIFKKSAKETGSTNKPIKANSKGAFFELVMGKIPSSKFVEVDPVFGIKAGGTTGAKFDMIVLKSAGKEFIAVPKDIYNAIIRYVERGAFNRKIGKDAEVQVNNSGVVVLSGKGEVIAAVRGKVLQGKMKEQAEYYYENYKRDSDKTYYDHSKSDGSPWGAPNEVAPSEVTINAAWKDLFREGLDTFDLVALTEVLINQTPQVKRMKSNLRGYFKSITQPDGKVNPKQLEVAVNRALQENPKDFTMTLAHEIGHLLDYLPQATIGKNNILGRMAAMKKYMNEWIDATGKDGTLPTKAEIAEIRTKAEAEAAKNLNKTDKEIETKLEIKPEEILDIFRDPDIRARIDPEFYDAFIGLSGALKKQITKTAMRKMIDPHIKSIVEGINAKRAKRPDVSDAALRKEANDVFARMMQREMTERGLVDISIITKELQKLSATWKPFNRQNDPKYTKYRDSSPELMADFMMAFLLRPNWTYVNAPRSSELFLNYMSKRPEVMDALKDIQFKMVAGKSARFEEVYTSLMNMTKTSNRKVAEAMENVFKENNVDNFNVQYIDTMGWFYRRFQGPEGGTFQLGKGRWMDSETLNLNYRMENWRYQQGFMEQYMGNMQRIVRNLEDMNLPIEAFSTMLILRNLAMSKQRAGMASPKGLWAELKRVDPDGTIIRNEIEGGRSAMELYKEFKKNHPALDKAATDFYAVRMDYMGELFKSSLMFSRKQVKELLDNVEYISFNNLKSLLNRIDKYGVQTLANSKIMKTKGTFEPVADVLLSTVQKDLMLIDAMKMNRAKLTAIQWMQKNKGWLETFDVAKAGEKDRVIQKAKYISKGVVEPAPTGMTTVSVMRLGKLEYWHMNKFAAKSFASNSVNANNVVLKVAQAGNDVFRGIFTEYNPRFWSKNLVRDIERTVRNLEGAAFFTKIDLKGFSNPKEAMVYRIMSSSKDAFKGMMGGNKTEIVNYMERNGFLLSTKEGYQTNAGKNAVRDAESKGYISRDQAILEQYMLEFGLPAQHRKWFNKIIDPVAIRMQVTARALDRMPKIGAYKAIKDAVKTGKLNMNEREMMLKVQQDYGSPAFLRTSEFHSVTNNFLIFYNAMKEGIRGDYVRFREDPKSVGLKYLGYELMPKMIQKAAELNFLGAWGTAFYMGISDYDKANYIVIPLGWYTDPNNGSKLPVYMRLPQDENARIINNLWYKGFNAMIGDTPDDFLSTFVDNTALSPNPAAELMLDAVNMFVHGENPVSSWTGDFAIDEDVWKADNHYTTKEKYRYIWNNYGGNTLYNWEDVSREEVYEGLASVLNTPVAGPLIQNFVKIGDTPAGNSSTFKKDMDLYEKSQAALRVAAQEAKRKLFNGKQDTITDEENAAFNALFPEDIFQDPLFKRMVTKKLGGSELVSMYITTKDKKKRLLMLKEIKRLMGMQVEGEFNTFDGEEIPINFPKQGEDVN
jgi:hypothetical protein